MNIQFPCCSGSDSDMAIFQRLNQTSSPIGMMAPIDNEQGIAGSACPVIDQ